MDKNRVVLIIVLDREGSSPGQKGFKMAVSENGDLNGSVGGGVMEYNMVEKARLALNEKQTGSFLVRQIHRTTNENFSSGMICSGEQIHAFVFLDEKNLDAIDQLFNYDREGNMGLIQITDDVFQFIPDAKNDESIVSKIEHDNSWHYSEQIGIRNSLYIFGAGHVSAALSSVFKILDFRISVFDDRKDLKTFDENKDAHEKRFVHYDDIVSLIPEGDHVYVVIMTFGHESDKLVLKQLLDKKVRYLGLMGSKRKVKSLFDMLCEEGHPESQIKRVHAPIGLSIHSQTPAEIAISIAAQIVKLKNE